MYSNITMSNLSEMKRTELLNLCRTNNIKGYSSKTKSDLIKMLTGAVSLTYVDTQALPPPIIVPPMPADARFKFIDLFCGIGGFHQALDKLGGHCVFASDIDGHCRNTYEKNYGLRPHGDITKVDPKTIPDFDILTGGFPCQSFSHSGKKGGIGDKRGQLYENILEIARVKKPSFMFLENVKHI